LDRILASVHNGTLAPLQGMVEDEEADEFARSAAIDAFLVLERTGQVPRAVAIEYFRSLFRGELRRIDSFVWDGLVGAVTDLPTPELLEEVREAYTEGLPDPSVLDLESVERDIIAPKPCRREKGVLITDAIAEMERWSCFQPEESQPEVLPEGQAPPPPPPPAPPPSSYVAPKPFVRQPKIGRNEPCPCGSGK
jgi:hypothetical protein